MLIKSVISVSMVGEERRVEAVWMTVIYGGVLRFVSASGLFTSILD